MIRRLCVLVGLGACMLLSLASIAGARGPEASGTPIQSCFGIAAAQRASTTELVGGVDENGLGTHTSSFDEPRVGIGNIVFRDALGLGLSFSSVGEAGSALASIDGIAATHCP